MNVCVLSQTSRMHVRMRMRRMHYCGGGDGKNCVCVDGVDDPTVTADDDAAHDGGDYDAASLMMPSK